MKFLAVFLVSFFSLVGLSAQNNISILNATPCKWRVTVSHKSDSLKILHIDYLKSEEQITYNAGKSKIFIVHILKVDPNCDCKCLSERPNGVDPLPRILGGFGESEQAFIMEVNWMFFIFPPYCMQV
jgi:hypothetical protein